MTSRIADFEASGFDKCLYEEARRVVPARRQCPGDAGHRAGVAVGHSLDQERKGLVVDDRRERLDIGHRLPLVGVSQRLKDGFDGGGTEAGKLLQGLLGLGALRIGRFLDLGDQALDFQGAEKAHPVSRPRPACSLIQHWARKWVATFTPSHYATGLRFDRRSSGAPWQGRIRYNRSPFFLTLRSPRCHERSERCRRRCTAPTDRSLSRPLARHDARRGARGAHGRYRGHSRGTSRSCSVFRRPTMRQS